MKLILIFIKSLEWTVDWEFCTDFFFHSLLSRGGPDFLQNKEGEKMAYFEAHSHCPLQDGF